MVGCCGQRGNNENQGGNREKFSPNMTMAANKTMAAPRPNAGQGHHDEEVCHGTGERRRDLLQQVKAFLDDFDDRPCTVTPQSEPRRPLGSYPEYLKKHCQSWMPPNPRPPLITSVPTHEIRNTSDYKKMKGETSEFLSFKDASLKIPTLTCDCVKRNGLQDQCPHPMCKPPTAQCKAHNPGPCCPPSLGLGGPPPVLESSKGAGGAGREEAREYLANANPGFQETAPSPYATTYSQDFRDFREHPKPMATSAALAAPLQGGGAVTPPPGMEIMCLCKVPSSSLQSGMKYLCCPIPQ